VRFCSISVRPYCGECKHWGPVNHGTAEDSISEWNRRSARVARTIRVKRDTLIVGLSLAVSVLAKRTPQGIVGGVVSEWNDIIESMKAGGPIEIRD
jgi:hypothetical protein